MAIWRMRIACWMTKAANTHSEYVIRIAFALQQWLRERASMLRYTYILDCLVMYYSPPPPQVSYSKDLALVARHPALVGSRLPTLRDSLSFPFP
jgi:hypothetical protein